MSRTVEFFQSTTTATGAELFASDGSTAGTGLLQDLVPGVFGSGPNSLTDLGTRGILFAAYDPRANGQELFVSGGTAGSTGEIAGNFLAYNLVESFGLGPRESSLSGLTPFGNDEVLFSAATTATMSQLWLTDGTAAGTVALASFQADVTSNFGTGVGVADIRPLGNGRALFYVSDSTQAGLYSTDGTPTGTVRLGNSNSQIGAAVNGRTLTFVSDGAGGTLFGVTDGTVAGTATVRDFAAPFAGGGVAVGTGQALFTVVGGNGADALWVTDGTAAGTAPILQGPAATDAAPHGLDIQSVTALGNGRDVFAARNGASRTVLWATDGTANGTTRLVDTDPGVSTGNLSLLASIGNGRAVFQAGDTATNINTLLITDGTSGGTRPLYTFAGRGSFSIHVAVLPNGRFLFDGIDPTGAGFLLGVSNGTAAGTRTYLDIPSTFGVPTLTALPDGRVTFNVRGSDGMFTLWSTSGTVASTAPIGPLTVYGTPLVAAVPDADPLFNSDYYLASNPDVAAANVTASQHYAQFGGSEGRSPDPLFDGNYYLTQNPDVKAAGVNPLAHFEQFGAAEGRDPSLLFSDSKYLAANPDVKAAGVNPLLHYLEFGQAEGRMAFLSGGTQPLDPLIDPAFYDPQLGASLIPTGTPAYQQAAYNYNTTGWTKGLNPDALFDAAYYLAHNADVAAAGVNPLRHYELFGWQEGRDPSAAFSTNKYLAANPDVAAARVDPLLQYFTTGAGQGRPIYHV